jgi:hypothetical protein
MKKNIKKSRSEGLFFTFVFLKDKQKVGNKKKTRKCERVFFFSLIVHDLLTLFHGKVGLPLSIKRMEKKRIGLGVR